MFAPLIGIAVRVAPVIVKIATHPRTIQAATTLAIGSSANIALRASRLLGEDKVGQRQAEAIHADHDPAGYAEDPRRISTAGQQYRRNAVLVGQSVATEARTFRVVAVPPLHLARYLKVRTDRRRYSKQVSKLETLRAVHQSDLDPTPEMVAVATRLIPLGERLSKRSARLYATRGLYQTNRVTPGEVYLANQIGELHRDATSNEVRVDTVEALFGRLMDDSINADEIDMNDPGKTGASLYAAVTTNFRGDEVGLIRARVLKGWLLRYRTVSDNQWRKICAGWEGAARASVSQTV